MDTKLEAIDVLKWISILAILGAIYFKVRSWEKSLRGEGAQTEIVKQPLKIELQREFMTRDEHRTFCGPMERRTNELEARMLRVEVKMESDKVEILERIDQLSLRTEAGLRTIERALGRLEGTTHS